VILDYGLVFVKPIVIASDGTGSHVHAFTDLGVSQISQVIGL